MKRLFVIVIIVMMIFQCCTTVVFAEDEGEWYYNISMNLRSTTGEYLPSPPVPLKIVQGGLIISAYNDCLVNNEMTLVLLCNGHVIPFSMGSRDNDPMQQTYITVPAKEEAELAIYPMLDGTSLQLQGIAYLHIALIGLCDVYPRNAFDDVQGFSTVVSIPVMNDKTIMDTSAIHNQPIEEATKPVSKVSNENLFYGIKILSVNDIERNTVLFRTGDDSQSLRFAIIPDDSDVYVCCLVDNVLQKINGYDGIWIHASKGMSYEGKINLNLTSGKHQIYLMCVPLFNTSPCFITSEKITVEVLP